MADEIANVFISHIHEDDERLPALKDLLSARGLNIRDGSVNSDKPNAATDEDYIKREILAPRISWAETLVVLISPETKDSWWVNWEIEYAHSLGKRIVGVWDHGSAECDLPDTLDQVYDALVGWQAERVRDAIVGKINNGENPQGGVRSRRYIARHGC